MINCTTNAVESLYLKRDWKSIFKAIGHIRIPNDSPLNINDYVHDQPNSVWEIIELDNRIKVHYNKSVINEISNRNDIIMEYPKDIFLIDKSTKKKISKKHGIIVMSEKSARATSLKMKWPGRLCAKKSFNWKSFFTENGRDMSKIPNNAIIFTDLYLFDDHWKQGIKNLTDILDEILPQFFDFDYHILIVTNISINRSLSTENAVMEIQKVVGNLKRSYPLILEVLFINNIKNASTEDEKACNRLFSASHNRRIYSNSFIMYIDHGFNTVIDYNGESQARWDQKTELQCNYNGIDNKYEGFNTLPYTYVDQYIEHLYVIINKSYNVGRYFINGEEKHPQNIVNRLIRL